MARALRALAINLGGKNKFPLLIYLWGQIEGGRFQLQKTSKFGRPHVENFRYNNHPHNNTQGLKGIETLFVLRLGVNCPMILANCLDTILTSYYIKSLSSKFLS